MSGLPETVGYRRPPVHTRFQKGQSGNPGGKAGPKTLARQAFDLAIGEAVNGDRYALKESRPAKVLEAFARRLALDAVDGKPSAQRLLLSILDREDREAGEETGGLSPSDFRTEESARAHHGDRHDEFNRRFKAAVRAQSVDDLKALAAE